MKNGKSHWLFQRITAIILIFLSPYFCFSLISSFFDGDSFNKLHFAGNELFIILFVFFISSLFYHAHLGIASVIYDYVQNIFIRNVINCISATFLVFISIFIIYSIC